MQARPQCWRCNGTLCVHRHEFMGNANVATPVCWHVRLPGVLGCCWGVGRMLRHWGRHVNVCTCGRPGVAQASASAHPICARAQTHTHVAHISGRGGLITRWGQLVTGEGGASSKARRRSSAQDPLTWWRRPWACRPRLLLPVTPVEGGTAPVWPTPTPNTVAGGAGRVGGRAAWSTPQPQAAGLAARG